MAGGTPSAYLDLLKSAKYSDFTIVCKDVEFKVHRAVVCSISTMLDTACSGNFQEATSGRIEFPEDDPEIISRVIQFMYTSDYDAKQAPAVLMPNQSGGSLSESVGEDQTPGTRSLSESVGEDQMPETRSLSESVGEDQMPETRSLSESVGEDQTPETGSPEAGLGKSVFETLKINALVYKCADMLGIENLKMLAADRFLTAARTVFMEEEFAGPLRVMYQSTRPDDEHLRVPITYLCVKNHGLFSAESDTVKVLEEHEHSVWRVYMPLLKEEFGLTQLKDTIAKINTRMRTRSLCCRHVPNRYSVDVDGSVKSCCPNCGQSQKI